MKKNVLSFLRRLWVIPLVFVFVSIFSFLAFTPKTLASNGFLANLFSWSKQDSSLGSVFIGLNIQTSGKTPITVPADLNTSYANGATETSEYVIIPSTTGFIQIDKKTGTSFERTLSGQIIDVVKISDTILAFLRRSEKYAFAKTGRPKTDINNIILYNLKDSKIIKTVELGNIDTHLANYISLSDDKKFFLVLLTPRIFGGASKLISIDITTYEVKEVLNNMGEFIRCGETQNHLFLCKLGGGVIPFSKKTLKAGDVISIPSETQGYIHNGTYEYFTLFREKKIVRRELKTGKTIEIQTASYPRGLFFDREKSVIFIASDDTDFSKDSWWRISSFSSPKIEKLFTNYNARYFFDTK